MGIKQVICTEAVFWCAYNVHQSHTDVITNGTQKCFLKWQAMCPSNMIATCEHIDSAPSEKAVNYYLWTIISSHSDTNME